MAKECLNRMTPSSSASVKRTLPWHYVELVGHEQCQRNNVFNGGATDTIRFSTTTDL